MRRTAGILLGFIVLAACSGGGGVDTSHDQAKADAAVLQPADVPGFDTDTSSSDSSDSSSSSDPADECFQQATGLDPNASDKDRTGKAETKLKKGEALSTVGVESSVELYKSDAPLKKFLDALLSSDITSCFEQAIKDSEQADDSGVTLGDVNTSIKPLTGIGDQGGEIVFTATIGASGLQVPFAAEINFVRVGRAALTVTVFAIGNATDHDLAVNGLKTMVTRLS